MPDQGLFSTVLQLLEATELGLPMFFEGGVKTIVNNQTPQIIHGINAESTFLCMIHEPTCSSFARTM